MIKMPPKQGKRGRPKGAGATTAIGLPKKRQKCTDSKKVAFRMKSPTENCRSEYIRIGNEGNIVLIVLHWMFLVLVEE